MAKSILWCTGYYKESFCKEKVKEIREAIKNNDERYSDYSRVAIVDKIKEFEKFEGKYQDVQYNRIRLYYK